MASNAERKRRRKAKLTQARDDKRKRDKEHIHAILRSAIINGKVPRDGSLVKNLSWTARLDHIGMTRERDRRLIDECVREVMADDELMAVLELLR